jgi:AbrB family looped-hinge helix DNA binding protein
MEIGVITSKGQIVIPKKLRDKYNLKAGTKIFFEETTNGISLRQIDPHFIKDSKGIIPKKQGEKPMKEWWPEFKSEEMKLEEKHLNVLNEPSTLYKRGQKIKRK